MREYQGNGKHQRLPQEVKYPPYWDVVWAIVSKNVGAKYDI